MSFWWNSSWLIYGRSRETNRYTEPLQESLERHDDLQYHMGRFKHEIYTFCLGDQHQTLKCLYLYNDYWRMAKCYIGEHHKLYIEFRDVDTATVWDACDEVLTSNKFAWKNRAFSNKYANVTDDYTSYVRSYLPYQSK